MRVHGYTRGSRRRHKVFIGLTRMFGAEIDDVGKVCLRRPDFFGSPFLGLTQQALRGPSAWTVAERELLATVVSDANRCAFCVGTHGEICSVLGREQPTEWADGRFGPAVTAAARFVEQFTRDPAGVGPEHVAAAVAAGVSKEALTEASYIAFCFNTINRIAHALDFSHDSDKGRRRGAAVLRRTGYQLPSFLLR